MSVTVAFLALVAELIAGYPDRLVKAIGHPVIWIGKAIEWADNRFNRASDSSGERRRAGILVLFAIVVAAAGTGLLAEWLLGGVWYGWAIIAVIASSLIAQRSLGSHVATVADALDSGGLEQGRRAVGHIVGRDTGPLDETGIARAAIESLAENFSDGVVAPVFWLALGGLPAIIAYKAINTADSMIGHRTERHADFGRAAARLDDLVNLPASRLSAVLVIAAAVVTPGASPAGAWRAVLRDAGNHRSPNAGWPESAFAGALSLELAGPRLYGGRVVEDAVMGSGGSAVASAADIRRALKLYWMADLILVAVLGVLTLFVNVAR